jgi:ribonuclease P protein component
MLKKENRLKKEGDLKRVLKKGKYLEKDFLLFRYLQNDLANSRFGIIVSKKAVRKAVKRNLLKRRIREAVRALFPVLKNNFDIVIIAKPKNQENNEFKTIKAEVQESFEKINK